MDDNVSARNESELFLVHADEMLASAKHSLNGSFYGREWLLKEGWI